MGTQYYDVRPGLLDGRHRIIHDLNTQPAVQPRDFAQILTHLRGIDVDTTHDLETPPSCNLPQNANPYRAEAIMHDANGHVLPPPIAVFHRNSRTPFEAYKRHNSGTRVGQVGGRYIVALACVKRRGG